ncbi:MAG: phospholipase [Clostridia bacterium]|nr:phospholipase [Clostridia bacterium]
MRFGSLKSELIYNTLIEELTLIGDGDICAALFPNSLRLLSKEFSGLDERQYLSIIELIANAYLAGKQEKVSLVATVPPSFSLKTKRIQNVAKEMIRGTQKSVMLTGYSISGFIDNLMDELISKSQKGILVKIFINDAQNQSAIDKLVRYKSRFLQLYNYINEEDKMAALHAKILTVDGKKTLISSANLSYHGMSGNIELGTIIDSVKIAKQVEELFKDLLFSKVFTRL